MKISLAKTRCILIPALIAALIITAGCIAQPAVQTQPADIPQDMYHAIDELTADNIRLEGILLSDLQAVAAELGAAPADEIDSILTRTYAAHPCLTVIVYCDAETHNLTSVPVFLDVELSDYSIGITEEDFKNAGGFIARNNVMTPYHGYQNLYYYPVRTPDGAYRGCVVFVVDIYSYLTLHPSMLGKTHAYDNYICFITDGDQILFSTVQDITGVPIPKNGYSDGYIYIPYVESGDGACTYQSGGYYIYDRYVQTEKIIAWHTLYSSHGQKYVVYLTRETSPEEMKTEDIFTVDVEQALNDSRSAFVYGDEHGIDKLAERIKSGYYASEIYLMDMKGTVIAAELPRLNGLSLMNIRSMYGVSYIESATLASEQGGGYITYLTPLERTFSPRASVYTLGIILSLWDDYYLFCKTPLSPDAVSMNPNLRPDLTQTSHAILAEVDEHSIEEVVEMINAAGESAGDAFVPNLRTKIDDIAILDMNGTTLASAKHPELIGESATFKADSYSASATRLAIMLAKTGGGYRSVAKITSDGTVILRESEIEPLDKDYFLYTAVDVGTFADVLTPVLEKLESRVS